MHASFALPIIAHRADFCRHQKMKAFSARDLPLPRLSDWHKIRGNVAYTGAWYRDSGDGTAQCALWGNMQGTGVREFRCMMG